MLVSMTAGWASRATGPHKCAAVLTVQLAHAQNTANEQRPRRAGGRRYAERRAAPSGTTGSGMVSAHAGSCHVRQRIDDSTMGTRSPQAPADRHAQAPSTPV